jgi:ABC-type polysaccharide/polyol phosphate export permease
MTEGIVKQCASTASDYSIAAAGREVWSTLIHAPQWATLAWNDIRLRYRRTTLGPLWITLGLGATVFSVGILYGVLLGNNLPEYLPYFAAGLIAWTFIGSTLSEGCAAYIGAAALIRAVPVAPAVHICRLITRQLIMLAHNLQLVVILWLLSPWPVGVASLLVVPGIALNLCAIFGAVLVLSIIAARFRDVQLIVSTVLQLVFLATPIMWEVKSLRGAGISYVADFNPFYHLIEIVRLPLLGKAPALGSWIFSGVTVVACLLVGHYFYARYRHRIAFWV